jgi:predicted dehydrogenase
VDIVAPTKFHYFYLEKFVKLNKNIFIEKPIVVDKSELDKLDKIINKFNYT